MVKQQDGDLVKIANGAFGVMAYRHPGIKNYIINKSRPVVMVCFYYFFHINAPFPFIIQLYQQVVKLATHM
ncbi:hypothetical protein AALB20_23295 [Niallia circulans]